MDGDSAGDDLEVSSSEDASSAIEPDKINLMTIHGSKGLQFPLVIVPFMEKKPNLQSHGDFVFDQELKAWSVRMPVGENNTFIGSPFEKVYVQKMRVRELEESKRLLYVAMTRAEVQLQFIWGGQCADQSWGSQISEMLDCNPGVHDHESFSYQVEAVGEIG